jgi:SAM-dependent methyltransferase
MPATPAKPTATQYDDPRHNYRRYWEGREYEHAAEEMAIRRLLKGRHFGRAADVGGGFGRISLLLSEYADEVTLAEPSNQQLELAEDFLAGHPEIARCQMQADSLDFADGHLDLVTMIRVMHHLPQPEAELRELARVLAPGGTLVLEVANYAHARNRVKHLMKRRPLPRQPVDIRSEERRAEGGIPFVNHHPSTVIAQLDDAGLRVEKLLSVSNLRSPRLKRMLPEGAMLSAERVLQPALASSWFGPSVFMRARKRQPA